MTGRICPVPGCHERLGETRQGDPWLMCRRHYARLDAPMRLKLWSAYRSWKRLERKYLAVLPPMRPPALLEARALAIQAYIDVRDSAIRQAGQGEPHQMEVAL